MPKILNKKEIEKRFKEKNLELLSEYKNNKTKVLVRCLNCGYVYKTQPRIIFSGYGCPNCQINRLKLSQEEVKKRFKKLDLELLSEYKNHKRKVKVKCLKCGHIWYVIPNNVFKGQRCPKCRINKISEVRKLSIEEVNKRLKNKNFKLFSEYNGAKEKIKVKCLKCGYIFKTFPDYIFYNKTSCPKCARKVPKWEIEIIEILKKYGIKNIIHQYKFNGKKIDIYLPDYKLGIELNGLYWHSYHSNIKNQYKDNKSLAKWHLYNKKIDALKKGIDIIFIFEHEFKNKILFNKILNFILAKIGIIQKYKIYARKCKFIEVDNKTAFKFYEKYHILGKPTYSKHFGLFYDSKLISLISFRKEKDEIILLRYCIHPKYKVIGGFQKLLKNSIKMFEIFGWCPFFLNKNQITTFVDLRFVNPDNNVFIRSGFKFVHYIEPRYFYWTINNDNKYLIIPRRKAQKKYLSKILPEFNPELTEEENMFINGFLKCYDAGKVKFGFNQ